MQKSAGRPHISLLVAAWNEERNLDSFLGSYQALSYANRELILCAGGRDKTYELAQRWVSSSQIVVLKQQHGEGKFRALQRCLKEATGEIIVLTDADCRLNDESFYRLIRPIQLGQACATTGTLRPHPMQLHDTFVWCQWARLQHRLTKTLTKAKHSSSLMGSYAAVCRRFVEAAYDTTAANLIGEDTYLALYLQQAGHQILRVPESYVETYFPDTFMAYVRQQSRWRRDWLLHPYRTGDRDVIWKGILSIGKHSLWLLLPLLVLPFGVMGLIAWLFVWGLTLAQYVSQYRAGRQSILQITGCIQHDSSIGLPLLSLVQFMIAESCAVVHVGVHLAIPSWRYRW